MTMAELDRLKDAHEKASAALDEVMKRQACAERRFSELMTEATALSLNRPLAQHLKAQEAARLELQAAERALVQAKLLFDDAQLERAEGEWRILLGR